LNIKPKSLYYFPEIIDDQPLFDYIDSLEMIHIRNRSVLSFGGTVTPSGIIEKPIPEVF